MNPTAVLIAYVVLILASSLLGGLIPSLVRLTHLRLQVALSLVGGLMLGIGLLHLLPHAVAQSGALDSTMLWVLAGLLTTFFLIRVFHFHEHGPAEVGGLVEGHHPAPGGGGREGHEGHGHRHGAHPGQAVRWLTVCLGLGLHTLIDGVTLGAAMAAEVAQGDQRLWAVGVFLAIVLHKPLDALSITTLMQADGRPMRSRQLANLAVALMCPLGAWGAWQLGRPSTGSTLLAPALAFAAGAFVCISLSDLLPELQFHRHDGAILSLALLGGIGLALAIGWVEPPHLHEVHPEGPTEPLPKKEEDGGPAAAGTGPATGRIEADLGAGWVRERGPGGRLPGASPCSPRTVVLHYLGLSPFLHTLRFADPPRHVALQPDALETA